MTLHIVKSPAEGEAYIDVESQDFESGAGYYWRPISDPVVEGQLPEEPNAIHIFERNDGWFGPFGSEAAAVADGQRVWAGEDVDTIEDAVEDGLLDDRLM